MSPANRFSFSLAAYAAAAMLGNIPMSASAINDSAYIEQSLIAQGAEITHHRLTGQTNFISTRAGKAIALPGTGTAQSASAASMDALKAYGTAFGLRNPVSELSQKSFKTITNGRSVIRYQQNYNGIPVIGGEMIVNLNANNGLLSINGEVSPKLAIQTKAKITAQQASNAALAAIAKWYQTSASSLTATTPTLSIYDPQLIGPNTAPASLVWRIEVTSTNQQPIRELILLDAVRGSISLHFNQVDTAMVRKTYTANETAADPGALVCNESDPTCSMGDSDAQNAHQFAKDTYDFYFNNHARDSIDGAGMTIISTTHWNDNVNCPNAFWDGGRMVYCTGLVVDDVVAHELTHGVTERTSNLFYYYQSGAINESLSDVWGEFVDLSNGLGTDDTASRWLLGEDATILGGAIRNMKNPPAFSDPDRIGNTTYYYTGSGDNGGVHINSGVNNKAVYLMVDGSSGETGGAFNGQTVTGIGITKTAKIYYEVQTNLLTSGADYLDLYNALYQGCQNLVGTSGITMNDCNQVRSATNAVEMNLEPTVNFNPDAAICPTGESVSTTVFSENFEGGLNNWTLTRGTGTSNWVSWNTSYGSILGPYAISGTESLFGDDVATTSDQRAAISVTLPAGQSYLRFLHSFDFESGYDGGVLEYRANGSSSWTDATTLFDTGLDYNGTLSAMTTNPLAGKSAFTGISHGYVSSRFNLLPIAGLSQPIEFRWRVGTDNSVAGMYGWFLDDVSVYTCSAVSTIDFSSPIYTVAENGTSATITVNRTGSSVGAVSVDYAINDGSATAGAGNDYTSTLYTGTLNWADTDTAAKTLTINVNDDVIYENTETVNLVLSNPAGTGGGRAELGTTPVASLAITDNDAVSTAGFSNTTYAVAENGTNITVTINRDAVNSTGAATVDYLATSGTATVNSDFTGTSGTLSWLAGESGAKTFTVNITDDTVYEGDETVSLVLSNPVGVAIGTGSATLTITENDAATSPTIAFTSTSYSAAENSGGATITVSRTRSSVGAVSVNYSVTAGTATSGSDFTAASGTLSWANGDMSNKSFNVRIVDDITYEGNETVNLVISSPIGGILGSTPNATLTITENDAAPSSGGGGGGALGWPLLLFSLLLLPLRRRIHLFT